MGETVTIRRYKNEYKTVTDVKNNIEAWIGYWRANPHRFIKEYIGGEIYPFQEILLYGMDELAYTTYAASRGLAKTSVGAWFAIERCILYPDQHIAVTAFEKGQAVEFIRRIEAYSKRYPNLAAEIEDIKTGINDACVKFLNKSDIRVYTNSEGSRSARVHIVIVDEFALFKDKKIIDTVFSPMMTSTRRPPYTSLTVKERKAYHEPNKEVYLSSIRTEAEWSWQYFLKTIDLICKGDNKYFSIALPYHYGVMNGYITEESVAKQLREHPDDIETTRAEYEAIPVRSDSGAFFKYQFFDESRTSTDILLPMTDEEFSMAYSEDKTKDKRRAWKYFKEKKTTKDGIGDEIRVMSVDIALIGGNSNDNTSINIFRLQPTSNGYKKLLAFCETMNGRHGKEQALRIKQLFYEFDCDYITIDAAGNGVGIVEYLMDYTEDSFRGITYLPWEIANRDEVNLNQLPVSNLAPAVIYAVKASASENHLIYNNAKRMLEAGEIELPATEADACEAFDIRYGFYKLDDSLRRRLLTTFAQTSSLVMEAINLVSTFNGANLKLEPKSGRRKDRFTSFVYGLWLIKRLEDMKRAKEKKDNEEILDYILFG